MTDPAIDKPARRTAVTRLVTIVDIDDRGVAPSPDDPREMSLSTVHLAVLDDGRRLTLLDDRGWGLHGPPDIWHRTSVEELEGEARMVVGPDEPFGSRSRADMEADHWAHLSGVLRQQDVRIDATELSRLRHDVELSERLRRRRISST